MLRPDSAATGILILSFLIHMERRLMKKKFPGKVYFAFPYLMQKPGRPYDSLQTLWGPITIVKKY